MRLAKPPPASEEYAIAETMKLVEALAASGSAPATVQMPQHFMQA
jgi:hypothetical protein